jgi:hypothetical protein
MAPDGHSLTIYSLAPHRPVERCLTQPPSARSFPNPNALDFVHPNPVPGGFVNSFLVRGDKWLALTRYKQRRIPLHRRPEMRKGSCRRGDLESTHHHCTDPKRRTGQAGRSTRSRLCRIMPPQVRSLFIQLRRCRPKHWTGNHRLAACVLSAGGCLQAG